MITRQRYSQEYVKKKVQHLAKLSTLPHIAGKVMELVENPKTSASTLGRIISADQVLAGRILKLANSAYYGFPRKISTISLAIVILGFNTLRDLVLSISVIDNFTIEENRLLKLNGFWRHALVVGVGARILSRYVGYPVAGEVFVAGLLHDIGYLVLFQVFPDLFKEIWNTSRREKISFLKAEENLLGFTHADVGSWLAEGWNLPDKLVKSIRYHHRPEKNIEDRELTTIIHVADLIAYSINETSGVVRPVDLPEADIERKVKELTRGRYPLAFFQKKFYEESVKAGEFLGILIKKPEPTEMVV